MAGHLWPSWSGEHPRFMSRLVALIDEYKDTHGAPSDSSIARAIGSKPQTISSWRTRGISEPPNTATLRKLAEFLSCDYETIVLRAALLDAGWVDEETPGEVTAAEAEDGQVGGVVS